SMDHIFSHSCLTLAGLAVTGTLTVVAGSMLERFWPVYKVRMLS
ncbi:MAG: hypothetical protein ACI9US_002197, partial [Gammaproteobacteria bacterium]